MYENGDYNTGVAKILQEMGKIYTNILNNIILNNI